jgi:outer membrane protein assembly factor BamB
MAPGRLQPFQVLNADGEEIVSSDWSVSDHTMAELKVEGGHAIVTARVAGHLFLTAGHADPVEIEILPDSYDLPHNVPRWILRPVDGHWVSALWATPQNDVPFDHAPAYFYLDRGESGTHVRAINEDALQVWQWPEYHSTQSLRPVCGDSLGGVIILSGEGSSRVLISVDASGHERWHVPASGFDGYAYTYTNNGTFFFVEEEQGGTKLRLVSLDPKTGDQKVSFELRGSHQTLKNLALRNDKLVCSQGTKTSLLPIRHSGLVSSSEAETHLVYSE